MVEAECLDTYYILLDDGNACSKYQNIVDRILRERCVSILVERVGY